MPQPRGIVPEPIASQLADAAQQFEEARAERDRLILEALKAGGSNREIATIARLSSSRIQQIGAELGWPDEAEQARRQAKADESKAWRDDLDRAAEVIRRTHGEG